MRILLSDIELPSARPRVHKVDVGRFDILGYDVDNGYPQRMETMINASSTAKQAVDKLRKYIIGQGFDKDQDFWNAIVNSKGETGDELLEKVAASISKHHGFALHINYNALFNGVEVQSIPFKNCRRGIRTRAGQIAISTNWWNNDRFGKNVRIDDVEYLDEFNPDAVAVKEQVRAAGGWKTYKGQIYYWTIDGGDYPEATCDAVLDSMEAEILSGQTSKNNIKNNFGDKIIWMQPAQDRAALEAGQSTPMSQDEVTDGLKTFVGPDGAQLILVEYESEADKPTFDTIENRLDDKKFAYTIENSRGQIYRNYDQPAILHSDLTQGRYNQNQLPEAMKYYNNNTEPYRIKVQRCFAKVFSIFETKFTADFSITPLNDLTSATTNTEGANNNGNTEDNPTE